MSVAGDGGVVVDTVGGLLGNVCGKYLCGTLWDFETAICIPHHPLRAVVRLVMASRRNRRTRRLLSTLDDAMVQDDPRPRWVREVLRLSYAVYCSLRRMAVPRGLQPTVADTFHVDIPQRVARLLTRQGVTWMTEQQHYSLKARSTAAWQSLWTRMGGGSRW